LTVPRKGTSILAPPLVKPTNRANAEHGRPRAADDINRGYRLAVAHGLVDGGDVEGVRELLACTVQWARVLTKTVREMRLAERRARVLELHRQGLKQRAIAERLEIALGTVNGIINSLLAYGKRTVLALAQRILSPTVRLLPASAPLQRGPATARACRLLTTFRPAR
jgi:hypothetical protein